MKKLILFFLLFNFNHLKAESELFQLLKSGYLEPIEKLIKDKSFKPHERSEREKESFLHRSVEFASKRLDQGEITDLLIRKGVFVNAKDKKGNSPLHLAIMHNQEKELKTLIYHGAYVNAQNQYGNTPLHLLAQEASRLGEILIRNGAYVNAQNQYGNTPLHAASYHSHTEISEILIKNGAYVNAQNQYGNTPLHTASYNSHTEISEILIKNGADVNAKDKHGQTPLHVASYKGHLKTVKILIKNGADANVRNEKGQTALMISIENKAFEISKNLITFGKADLSIRDFKGKQTLDYLENSEDFEGKKELKRLITRQGATFTFLSKFRFFSRHPVERFRFK